MKAGELSERVQKIEEFRPETWYNLITTKNTPTNQEEFFMANYTTKIGVLKRTILNFTDEISAGTNRPFRNFTADMCYGAIASKSCVISEISQALQEGTKRINTI